jgi:hypothetical protein
MSKLPPSPGEIRAPDRQMKPSKAVMDGLKAKKPTAKAMAPASTTSTKTPGKKK